MCGRFCCACSKEKIADRLGVDVDPAQYKITYNAAPAQNLSVVTNKLPTQLSSFRWGLIPNWTTDKSISAKMINARLETLHEKPSFKEALERRRCLVPATGFYEWKKEGTKKKPYYIHLLNSELFCFAGLWDSWKDKESGNTIYSFTIITTTANSLIALIHDRMPVILPSFHEKGWLNGELSHKDLIPFPVEQIEMYSVSTSVNSVYNNDPALIQKKQELSFL
jgi:putative SOS response-associated peptidase YedK